jgi:cell division protein ZapA (FtsZ GTPase activity inhibitor)
LSRALGFDESQRIDYSIARVLTKNNEFNAVDYNILGYNVRLKSTTAEEEANASEIIRLVREEAQAIQEQAPHLSRGEVALMVALTLAEKNQSIQDEFKDSIQQLQGQAGSVLQVIEELSPSS